jgi:hypothetical protein
VGGVVSLPRRKRATATARASARPVALGNLAAWRRRLNRRQSTHPCWIAELEADATSVAPFPAGRRTAIRGWVAGGRKRLRGAAIPGANTLRLSHGSQSAGDATGLAADDGRQSASGSHGHANVIGDAVAAARPSCPTPGFPLIRGPRQPLRTGPLRPDWNDRLRRDLRWRTKPRRAYSRPTTAATSKPTSLTTFWSPQVSSCAGHCTNATPATTPTQVPPTASA